MHKHYFKFADGSCGTVSSSFSPATSVADVIDGVQPLTEAEYNECASKTQGKFVTNTKALAAADAAAAKRTAAASKK